MTAPRAVADASAPRGRRSSRQCRNERPWWWRHQHRFLVVEGSHVHPDGHAGRGSTWPRRKEREEEPQQSDPCGLNEKTSTRPPRKDISTLRPSRIQIEDHARQRHVLAFMLGYAVNLRLHAPGQEARREEPARPRPRAQRHLIRRATPPESAAAPSVATPFRSSLWRHARTTASSPFISDTVRVQ